MDRERWYVPAAMSTQQREAPADEVGAADPGAVTVLVCRGCCCGTERKHPQVDHLAQLNAIRDTAERARAQVRVTDCLDACDRSNVLVLRRRQRSGTVTVWLGGVLAAHQTSALCDWMAGPRRDPTSLPDGLQELVFEPSESARSCLDACVPQR